MIFVEVFDSKVRQVGSSFGVLIPKEAMEEAGIKKGQDVKVAIIARDLSLLEKEFGSAKTRPFAREHNDRRL